MQLLVHWKNPEKHSTNRVEQATFGLFGVDSLIADGKEYVFGTPEWSREIKKVVCLGREYRYGYNREVVVE